MMLNETNPTRRKFLGTMAASFGVLATRDVSAQAPAVLPRKSAKNLSEAEWATLERGVMAMKAIPKSSPVSWWFQANMHDYPMSETGPIYEGWGGCQHGNWWFLPWHRAYLFYFERIFQAYCGDPNFRLPYWDWTDPEQQSLPPRFLDPRSPLYESDRKDNINQGGPINPTAVNWPFVSGQSVYSTPLPEQGFGSQAVATPGDNKNHGAMEALCHDLVHDQIGGLMGSPETAAQDPIFWLHHANVDRCFGAWLRAYGGSNLPSNSTWRNTPFPFYGPQGTRGYDYPYKMLNTPNLGYVYEDYPPIPRRVFAAAPWALQQQTAQKVVVWSAPPATKTLIASQQPPSPELTSKPLTVTFAPDERGKARVAKAVTPRVIAAPAPGVAQPPPTAGHTIQVVIDDIRFDKSPGRSYELYVNLPDPSEAKGPGSLYYGGSLSFFALSSRSHGHAGHGMEAQNGGKTATIDITDAAARLNAAGKLGNEIKVTLIERSSSPKPGVAAAPAGNNPPARRVTIGSIKLQYSGD